MLNNPFYNGHIRSAIIAFGRMFSGIQIVRVNPNDATKNQTIDIPLSYAPREKALVRINQDPTLTNQVHTVLPLMSFEILGFTYDASRKLNRMNRIQNKGGISYTSIMSYTVASSTTVTSSSLFANVTVGSKVTGAGIPANTLVASKASDSSLTLNHAATLTTSTPTSLTFYVDTLKQTFTPVPYNLDVSLYILTKSQEDNLQIVEQILPVFTPEYTVSIEAMPDLNLQNDVPIVLNSVQMQDDYEGDFQTRRFVTTTLSFTLKLNLYGGVGQAGVITKTIEKFAAVKDLNDTLGAKEILTSIGTTKGGPITDTWTIEF